jgi:hypothetical protein
MAVFFDTGGGDIYGAPTREAVIAAMRADAGEEIDLDAIVEVSGSMKMRVEMEEDDDSGEFDTILPLEKEYIESLGAYCVATENW